MRRSDWKRSNARLPQQIFCLERKREIAETLTRIEKLQEENASLRNKLEAAIKKDARARQQKSRAAKDQQRRLDDSFLFLQESNLSVRRIHATTRMFGIAW